MKPISRFINSVLIKNENFLMKTNTEIENKLNSQSFINSFISVLNIDSKETADFIKKFFINIKIYDTQNLKSNKYFNSELLENFEIEESFDSEFDGNVGSIVFYRNTFLSYRIYDALSNCIIEELSKQFTELQYSLEQAKTIIVELLASKEENYGQIINECKKFNII